MLRLMLKKEVHNKISKIDSERGYISLSTTPQLEDFLVEKGIDPRYGARTLKPLIEKYIKEEIAVRILNQGILSGDMVLLDIEFANPKGETFKEKGEAHIVIRRADRPAGGDFNPFNVKKEGKPMHVGKELDDFLQSLFDSYKHLVSSAPGTGYKPKKKKPSE